MPIVYGGYVIPPAEGSMIAGSTYSSRLDHPELLDEAEHQEILKQAQSALRFETAPEIIGGRSALRMGLRDALPILGRYGPHLIDIGYGSKAYSHALLGAETLATEIMGFPAPLGLKLRKALSPQRFAQTFCEEKSLNAIVSG